MTEPTLKPLSSDTVRLIGSTQVITSVFSVVKELVENSLDAGSTTIEIKLEDFGLEKVEVRDNGHGIRQSNLALVAKRYYTSKISSFSDLDKLSTYGFRGEALGSLCAVCDLSITSKTCEEGISHTAVFDHHGNVVSTTASHLGQGTTITACKLFRNLPVRRQYYNPLKKKKEELKKIEDLLLAYGVVRPDVRLLLKNNKDVVWQKSIVPDTRIALLGVLGNKVFSQLQYRQIEQDEPKINMEAYLPSAGSEVSVTSRSTGDRSIIAINSRPIENKDIEKCVRQYYCNHSSSEGRHPVYFLHIRLPSGELDVNVDPNKTRVLLHQQKEILSLLKRELEELYGPILKASEQPGAKQAPGNTDFDDTVNTTILSPESSFDKSLDETIPFKRPETKFICRSETEKTSFASRLKTNKENIQADNNSGFKISFYEGNEDTDMSENANICTENKELDTDKAAVSDVMSQIERGDFSIIDADLEDLLSAQIVGNAETACGRNPSAVTSGVASDIKLASESVEPNMGKAVRNDIADVCSDMFDDTFEEAVIGSLTDSGSTKADVDMKVDENKNVSVLEWSRGSIEKGADRQALQPVTVLTSVKRGLSPDSEEEEEKRCDILPAKKRPSMDQPSLYEMVARSPGEKSSMGFMAFSREVRPQVIASNPEAGYDKITGIVKLRWNKLSDIDKEMYTETGSSQMQDLRKKMSDKQRPLQKIDHRIMPVKGIPSIKDQLLSASRRVSGASSVPQKSVKVPFSLTTLRHVYTSGLRFSQTQASERLEVIGPLKFYNGWVCCRGDTLSVINPHRAEEMLVYQGLMESHVIPSSRLEEPIRLDQRLLGDNHVEHKVTLTSLIPQDCRQTYIYIEDKRLIANGIQIRCHLDESNNPLFDLVSRAFCMPTFGVSDVREVLELIRNTDSTQLVDCRPLKVKFYLQGEAVRMVRQRPLQRNHEDIVDILEQRDQQRESSPLCLHDKPILSVLIDLAEIPNSQASLLEKTFA